MTRGAPHITNRDTDRQQHNQAATIHQMAARGVPEADIAAANGCALARVRAVLAAPAPAPDTRDPLPAEPTSHHRYGLTVSRLLTATLTHPDPRVARLAAHIRADLTALRALHTEACARAEHAAHLAQIEARMAEEHTQLAARHRRRSDGISA